MDTPKYTSKKIKFICIHCGKEFYRLPSEVKRGAGTYCSNQCSGAFRTKKMELNCLHCHKVFIGIAGADKFCSHECYSLNKQNKVERICEYCGDLFLIKPVDIKRGRGRFCGRECSGLAQRGLNSPSWRGGHGKYRGENWIQQRKLAYDRAKGVCQYCGKKPIKGVKQCAVHHIKPFREFNGDYIAANQLTNLVVLCHPCHMRAEHGNIPVQPYLL